MQSEIVNRVANSGLITFNLEDYYRPGPRVMVDFADQLYQGQILKEKDFREFVKTAQWHQYQNSFVAITCSADAIVPIWAYMLVALALRPYAARVVYGNLADLEKQLFFDQLARIDWQQFVGAKVVIKGCSKVEVPLAVYVEVVNQLRPYVGSLMYGEPCSTVPLYKAPKDGFL
jgi:hypothetical protein